MNDSMKQKLFQTIFLIRFADADEEGFDEQETFLTSFLIRFADAGDEGFDEIMVLLPSSRQQASVHRTLVFYSSNPFPYH